MIHIRGRVRFGLRTLLLVMTALCILLALVAQPMIEQRRERALLAQVTALGARISSYGTIARDWSPVRTVLALFDTSYGRYTLVKIDLSGTEIDDGDLAILPKIRHVIELNLCNTAVTDSGMKHLTNLGHLKKFDLVGTHVTDLGIKYLEGLNDLASLRVTSTAVSYDALEALDAKLPYANFCEEKAIEELKAAGIQVVDSNRLIEGDPARGNWIIHSGPQAEFIVVGMNRSIALTRRDVENLNYSQVAARNYLSHGHDGSVWASRTAVASETPHPGILVRQPVGRRPEIYWTPDTVTPTNDSRFQRYHFGRTYAPEVTPRPSIVAHQRLPRSFE